MSPQAPRSPLVAAAWFTWVCACGGASGAPGPGWGGGGAAEEPEASAVSVGSVTAARIERHYRTSGTLEALRAADIVPIRAGILREILVEEGDTVTVGQVLARLDSTELSLQAGKDTLAVANAEQELGRLEAVAAKQALSQEEVAKQRYLLDSSRAVAKLSRHQAGQSVIRAPFSGTITSRKLDIGNLATSSPVFGLADVSALELALFLPEREASTVGIGTSVDLELLDGTHFTAQIIRRAPVVDALTGTVRFTARATSYPVGAVPGGFVRATVLVAGRDGAPSLPRAAVFEVEGVPHVYRVVEGKARRTKVDLGLEGETLVEVRSGLAPSDVIVLDGAGGISEGMPLRSLPVPVADPQAR